MIDEAQPTRRTSPEPLKQRRWIRWVPLALAVGWLIPSVIFGLKLIQDEPSAASALNVTPPNLSAMSAHILYGGDAYSGIQNAASDTEHAVVKGTNALAAFELSLQQAAAAQDAARSANSQARIEDGLGFLLIAIAVLNCTVALGRLTNAR